MNWYVASEFIAIFSACLLGLFVFIKNKKNPINRFFFFMNINIAIWNIGDFLVSISPNQSVALLFDRISNFGVLLIVYFFVKFAFAITKTGITPVNKILNSILNLYILVLIPLLYTPLIIKGVVIIPFKEIVGNLYFLFILFFIYGFSYSLYILFKGYKHSSGLHRNQLKYVFLGLFVGFLGGIVYFISIFTKFPPIHFFIETIYLIIIAFAILRHHLMDIDFVFKKTVFYTILSTSVIGIYVATILTFESIFQSFTGYSSLAIKIVAGFIITATFQPLRSRIEIIIDNLFFRGKLDHQEAIAEFTHLLVTVLDLRELLNLIVSMSGLLNTRQVAIFLFDEDTAHYKIRASTGLDQITKEIEFDAQSDLVRLLISTRKVVLRSKIESAYTSSDYAILHAEIDSLKAIIAIPIFIKNSLKGILLLGEKLSEELYSKEDINMLTTLADEAGIAIENAQLYGDLKRTYLETVQALAQAIEASDKYTRGHSDRVTKMAIQIARELKISRVEIDTLKIACILHDVGKIGIIKEVLNKPDKLNEAEFNIIKKHPALGEEIIAPVAFLAPIKPIVRHHHERFDGRGYPDGLKSESIPYLSRIIAVADTYDAMTSERPYRPALSTEIALAEIKRCSGTQFDPEIVKAFLELDHSI